MKTALVVTAAATAIGIALIVFGVFLRVEGTDEDVAAGGESEHARVLRAARRLWNWLTPVFTRNLVDKQLDEAGYWGPAARNGFILVQLTIGAVLWLIALWAGIALRNFLLALVLVVAAGAVARTITFAALSARVSMRRREILASLPDMLDLIAIGTEAGQPLNMVLARTRTAFHDALGDELGRALREIDLGVPRGQAMSDMAARTGVSEMRSFTQAVIESTQLGVGLANLLRLQAEDQRKERQVHLQENAARTGLMILVPTAGCIFPALYVIILGPAAISFLPWLRGH